MIEVLEKDESGIAIPPFAKCPEIKRGSIGWRMGFGEEYNHQFKTWWAAQDQETRLKTKDAYPEPEGWDSFWIAMLAQPIGE